MKKQVILFGILIFAMQWGFAQKERSHIRKGNKLYTAQKYTDADVEYRKALEEKNQSFEAQYNLGDALYKEKKYDAAINQYGALLDKAPNKKILSGLYHNIGNAYLNLYRQNQGVPDTNHLLDKSIEAYRRSLKANPNDNDTKKNMSYALRLRQQQKKQQQQNKQNKKQNKKNNQKQKNQQKKQNQNKNKKKQDNKKQQQNKQKQQQQKTKPQQQKISKKDAERILNALKNNEAKLQKKLKKQKASSVKVKDEKDW